MNDVNEKDFEIKKDDVVLEAEFDDAEPTEEYVERPNDTVLYGWFFWRIFLIMVPVVGLIYAIIASKLTKNINKKRFLHAGIVWNAIGLALALGIIKGVSGYIKSTDKKLHAYLGNYGSTLELAQQIIAGEYDEAVDKIDFKRLLDATGFEFRYDLPQTLPIRELLANLDFETILNQVDFSRVNWGGVTDEQLRELYKALPLDRIR